jgi:predicted ATPase
LEYRRKMKIKFSNLGGIQETELDLRPLTVIIGPNNSNKTYIAYLLENRRYKLLKDAQRAQRELSSTSLFDLSKDQDDILYPQPVEDFLDFLSNIELQKTTKINPSDKNEFQKLADEIENQLQNKNKTNLKSTKLGGKEIKVSVKRGLEIDLYNASSSIKQLAPLLLYLRYRASKGDFLVIDEPEMNLHPESQAKLLEALSILVNLGVRILFTTHSPLYYGTFE